MVARSHMRPRGLFPLRASDELGRWVSVRQLRAVEPHCVLAHVSLAGKVRRFLGEHAEPGWRAVPPTRALPSGWALYDRVRITSHAAAPDEDLDRLVPRFGTASRLEGGLEVAPGQYLVGGEPDLWVTVAEGDRTSVVIDGESADLTAGVVRFRLSDHRLKPGEHYVQVGGLTRRFATFGGFETASPSGTGSLGEVLRAGRDYVPEAVGAHALPDAGPQHGTVQISGASAVAYGDAELPEGDAPPILLPAGFKHYTVLGRVPGQVLETWDRGKPWWLNGVGLGRQYQFFDQPVPFEAQWVVLKGRGGSQVRPVRRPVAAPTAEAADDAASVAGWRAAVLETGEELGLRSGRRAGLEAVRGARASSRGSGVSERYDRLLEFLSEKGSGEWKELKEAFDWIWGPTDDPAERAWIAARDLAALGHIEVAWGERIRWCAAPPLLTMLPAQRWTSVRHRGAHTVSEAQAGCSGRGAAAVD